MSLVTVHMEFNSIAEVEAFFAGKTTTKPSTPTTVADHLEKLKPAETVKENAKAVDAKPAAETKTTEVDPYRPLGDKIAKLVAKNRNAAVEILAGFGVKKGPELKPDQWPSCEAKVDAALLA